MQVMLVWFTGRPSSAFMPWASRLRRFNILARLDDNGVVRYVAHSICAGGGDARRVRGTIAIAMTFVFSPVPPIFFGAGFADRVFDKSFLETLPFRVLRPPSPS